MKARFAFDVCLEVYRNARVVLNEKLPTLRAESSNKYAWKPDRKPGLAEYAADFALAGERALRKKSHASRLIMFRVYYLGDAEYQAARGHLGISSLTWADWAEEIRDRVGRELIRRGLFPPGRYFHCRAVRRKRNRPPRSEPSEPAEKLREA